LGRGGEERGEEREVGEWGGRREGREREGREKVRGKGDRGNGTDGRGHGTGQGGKGKEEGDGKGVEGLQPSQTSIPGAATVQDLTLCYSSIEEASDSGGGVV